MPLTAGTRLGPYEVEAPLGTGGMGEVYRARDTRLDRVVAIKIIQPAAAASLEMRERFEREARAISALDHPHICTLYDVCREGDVSFLVMQFLEGETLADRLARAGKPASDPSRPASGTDTAFSTTSRGSIPFETTMKYAVEIAQALDAAHRRGIVHRDLKPGNVMLTKTGTKLLDFGLAKLATDQPTADGFGQGAGETRTLPLTGQGAILGTLHYMSPEQLEGRDVDSRSDIHAFGAVLFEMLSGRRAFDGQSQAGIIAAIVGADAPAFPALADPKVSVPGVARRALERLVAKCLAKDPDARWQSAADLAAELQWIDEERRRAAPEPTAPIVDPTAALRGRRHERLLAGVAATAVVALGGVTYRWYPRPAPPPPPITFTIEAPQGETLPSGPGLASVSPDGTRVAFVVRNGPAADSGPEADRLWIRNLDSPTSYLVPRTEGAWQPVWSPDGRAIAFTSSGGAAPLRTIELATGNLRTLVPAAFGTVAWNRRGVILFQSGNRLMSVPDTGGTPVVAMEPDLSRQEIGVAWPVFLPDDRRYVFLARSSNREKTGLFLASLDAPGRRTFLVNAFSSVEYSGGYLFYQRDGTLMAHPFDADAGRLTGDPVPVVQNVRYNGSNGRASLSVSAAGVLVYAGGDNVNRPGDRRVTLFDRFGKSPRQIGPAGSYSAAMLSPDGRRAIVTIDPPESTARRTLSLLDLERGLLTPFTLEDVDERNPIWSPDGASIVFGSLRNATFGLYRRSAAGGATREELLFSAQEGLTPFGFSPDGAVLLFGRGALGAQRVWALPLAGDRKPVEAIPGLAMAQAQATFSPDGKWIAFGAGTGRGFGEIYIQPFPADDRRVQISTATGRYPYWTADGRQIVYRSTSDDFMAVELTPEGRSFRASTPVKLFNSPKAVPGNSSYSMDARGERFLTVVPPERIAPVETVPLTVIVNWVANLKKR
jgi:eukaryotic-like serine/threonine-protein kinase